MSGSPPACATGAPYGTSGCARPPGRSAERRSASPAAAAALAIDRPLVDFVFDEGLLPDGGTDRWAAGRFRCWNPRSPPGWHGTWRRAHPANVRDAIGGLSAAIELADVDPPPRDVRAILAGNIFHRNGDPGPRRHQAPHRAAHRPPRRHRR